MKILAISGSLRAGSSNSAILRVAARVAPPPITVTVHNGLDALPFFNPDLDRALDDPALPFAVCQLRQAIAESDAVLISPVSGPRISASPISGPSRGRSPTA